MKTAVNYLILLLLASVFLSSCGRAEAETVLLDSGEETSAGDAKDAPAENTAAQPTETPVIQVVCNCRCAENAAATAPPTESAQPAAPAETAQSMAPAETVQPAAPTDAAQSAVPDDGKVNINTADAARLQTLNGIGETRAQAIISYREAHGMFQSIEDIKNVSGIKDGIYDQIKEDISV